MSRLTTKQRRARKRGRPLAGWTIPDTGPWPLLTHDCVDYLPPGFRFGPGQLWCGGVKITLVTNVTLFPRAAPLK